MSKEFVFKSKNGKDESTLTGPQGDCKASRVLWDTLNSGPLPDGLNLRFAKSYNAHYLEKKGRNALGFFDTNNLLVINGIADDLEKAGIEKIVRPSKSKKFRAIRLNEASEGDLKKLISTVCRVLGISTKAPGGATEKTKSSVPKKKIGKKAKAPVVSPVTV